MGTPIEHSNLSAKRFGGKPEDYLAIHELMDSSKAAFADLRHRALTHNSWFVTMILEKVFGPTITNSEGQTVSVRDIGQFHVMEDFNGGFPSAGDFLLQITYQPWMDNGKTERPPSNSGLPKPDLDKLYMKNPESEKPTFELDIEPFRRRSCGGPGMLD